MEGEHFATAPIPPCVGWHPCRFSSEEDSGCRQGPCSASGCAARLGTTWPELGVRWKSAWRPKERRAAPGNDAARKRCVRQTKLNSLLLKCSGDWSYFDPVYRFYHQSFKVFGLQSATLELVGELQALAPDRKLNARFMKIVTEGTGKTFELEHNRRWDEVTRPILEAFFHARFFLECAVRSARTLKAPPQVLPSDWAALLYLFDLR
jgi:hypothetical protein